ncbi:hypothetical protein SAMN05414139_05641 [Burkholderia sp. D7]|nr:hypothetical protein SAMN05414139_05641 [Burkholderia sp. D7]
MMVTDRTSSRDNSRHQVLLLMKAFALLLGGWATLVNVLIVPEDRSIAAWDTQKRAADLGLRPQPVTCRPTLDDVRVHQRLITATRIGAAVLDRYEPTEHFLTIPAMMAGELTKRVGTKSLEHAAKEEGKTKVTGTLGSDGICPPTRPAPSEHWHPATEGPDGLPATEAAGILDLHFPIFKPNDAAMPDNVGLWSKDVTAAPVAQLNRVH